MAIRVKNALGKVTAKDLFAADDLLALRLADGQYRAAVCARVSTQSRQRLYELVPTTYKAERIPTPESVLDCAIACGRIPTGFDADTTILQQPGIDELWKLLPNERRFVIGLDYCLVRHGDMRAMAAVEHRITRVGSLRIREAFKQEGSYLYVDSFEKLENVFSSERTFRNALPAAVLCDRASSAGSGRST